jgi:hypothetical protein
MSKPLTNLPTELLLDILEASVQENALETAQLSSAQRWALSSTCSSVYQCFSKPNWKVLQVTSHYVGASPHQTS